MGSETENSNDSMGSSEDKDIQFNELKSFNKYTDLKTLSKGFVDIALITTNANQLRFFIYSEEHSAKIAMISLVSISIFIQVFAGCLLMVDTFKKKACVKDCDFKPLTNIFIAINVLMFLNIILNIFIVAFTDPTK